MTSPPQAQITILVAEAQPIYRLGLRRLLGVEEDFHVIAAVESGAEALEAVRKFQPDLLLLDRAIPDHSPFELIREVRRVVPQTRIVLLSHSMTDEEMVEAIRCGVRVVLPKEVAPEALTAALRKAHRGETLLEGRVVPQGAEQLSPPPSPETAERLTPRELEIIGFIAQGFRNKEIAARLSLSEQTVKNILRNVFDKLGVSDRLELALYAIHHRLFPSPASPS